MITIYVYIMTYHDIYIYICMMIDLYLTNEYFPEESWDIVS